MYLMGFEVKLPLDLSTMNLNMINAWGPIPRDKVSSVKKLWANFREWWSLPLALQLRSLSWSVVNAIGVW